MEGRRQISASRPDINQSASAALTNKPKMLQRNSMKYECRQELQKKTQIAKKIIPSTTKLQRKRNNQFNEEAADRIEEIFASYI